MRAREVVVALAAVAFATPAVAHAEETPAPRPRKLPAPDGIGDPKSDYAPARDADDPDPTRVPRAGSDMDGVYITLGPVASGVRLRDAWHSGAGAELSVVVVREHRLAAALGVGAGGVSYVGAPGGRFWIEPEAATRGPFGVGIGIGAGPCVEIDGVNPWRWGGQATLWLFTGVIPYARAGWVEHSGSFYEAGIMIKIPARRF